MLKKEFKKKTKIIALVGSLCFSLIALVSSTFSWFFASREAQNGADNLTILSTTDFDITYRILKFDTTTKKGVESKTSGGKKYNFALDAYDTYVAAFNDYLSQLIEVTLTANTINLSASDFTFSIFATSEYYDEENKKVFANMSNLVSFKMLRYSYELQDGSKNTSFTFGNLSRYFKERDEESTIEYGDSDAGKIDQAYQEVRNQFKDEKYTPYYFVDPTAVAAIPDESEAGHEEACKAIQKNTKKEGEEFYTLNIQSPLEGKEETRLPANWKKAVFYVQYDYSKVLAEFFAKKARSIVTKSTGALTDDISVDADFTMIKVANRSPDA